MANKQNRTRPFPQTPFNRRHSGTIPGVYCLTSDADNKAYQSLIRYDLLKLSAERSTPMGLTGTPHFHVRTWLEREANAEKSSKEHH